MEGKAYPGSDPAAIDVGTFALRLERRFFAFLAAATWGRSWGENVEPMVGHAAALERRSGTLSPSDFDAYLAEAAREDDDEFERVWLTGCLVQLGDALQRHGYFDRAPILELVRHLRNGVGHGNTFRIDNPSKLDRYPAHARAARGPDLPALEITPAVDGTEVLFAFASGDEIAWILRAAGRHLLRIGGAGTAEGGQPTEG
jgi:hypothetical protein